MSKHSDKKLRVVQWATGNIGTRSLRSVIEHPAMQLVGLYVHSEAKHGKDAGSFCGLGPTGIKATRDIEEILKLEADCVLYMQQGFNVDDVCRILASGKNIVTTRTEINNPAGLDAPTRQRIEDACTKGGTSIHATGSSPGFITEALPLVLTSMLRRLDHLQISEYANLAPRNSPELLFQIMGFGQAPDPRRDAGRAHHLRQSFAPSLQLVAEAMGLSFDTVEAHGDVALASKRTQLAAGVIEAGTVAAQRATVSGLYKGEKLMTFTANWYCTTDIDADWKLRTDGWRVEMSGDVPMDIDIRFPVSAEQWPLVSPGLTAHRAVNAIAYVCAAAPGIRTTVDLPQIISDLR
ncbi:MAG: dihydrodipicolinate reductase [Pseudomonadota bacterium]|nr:dihydrodipicolinate reductase [Pseudomonadota bacterium]